MNPERRLIEAPEIKEYIPRHEIAFAFVKPDNVDDYESIRDLIEQHGLSIVFSEKVRLDEAAIDYMYHDSIEGHFYPAMKKYLMDNEVVVLMVGGKGHDAQEVLSSLKKKNGKDGPIRERFQKEPRVSPGDLTLWEVGNHPRQDDMTVVLTQKNVIHTADSTEDALRSLKMILGPKFQEMERKGNLPAELWGLFEDGPKE